VVRGEYQNASECSKGWGFGRDVEKDLEFYDGSSKEELLAVGRRDERGHHSRVHQN